MSSIFGVHKKHNDSEEKVVPESLPDLAKDLYERALASQAPAQIEQSQQAPPVQQPHASLVSKADPGKNPSQGKPMIHSKEDIEAALRAWAASRPSEPAPLAGNAPAPILRQEPRYETRTAPSTASAPEPRTDLVEKLMQQLHAMTMQQTAEPFPEADEPSFFEALQNSLIQGEFDVIRREIFERDGLDELREFHKAKAAESFLNQQQNERKLLVLLEEMRRFESQWVKAKKDADRANRRLLSLEGEIQIRLDETKPLLQPGKIEEPAPAPVTVQHTHPHDKEAADPNEYFRTADGRQWKSISQFKEELPFLSEYAFYAHVTPYKNDFSAWMRGVFKDEDFAKVVESCKTKEELVSVLSQGHMQVM